LTYNFKYEFFFILLTVVFLVISCDIEDFSALEHEFYYVRLDATSYSDNNTYFLFYSEEYVERIDAGNSQDMSFYYFGNTLCQLDLNGKRNCVDIEEQDQIVKPLEPKLKDIIRLEYSGVMDTVNLYRYYPLEENYFKTELSNQDTVLFLPALLNDVNRIILSADNTIILDTLFYVSDQPITIVF